jgi:hypothetical protein
LTDKSVDSDKSNIERGSDGDVNTAGGIHTTQRQRADPGGTKHHTTSTTHHHTHPHTQKSDEDDCTIWVDLYVSDTSDNESGDGEDDICVAARMSKGQRKTLGIEIG